MVTSSQVFKQLLSSVKNDYKIRVPIKKSGHGFHLVHQLRNVDFKR